MCVSSIRTKLDDSRAVLFIDLSLGLEESLACRACLIIFLKEEWTCTCYILLRVTQMVTCRCLESTA